LDWSTLANPDTIEVPRLLYTSNSANQRSLSSLRIKIKDRVLIAQGLEIAIVNHVSLIPVQRKSYAFSAPGLDVRTTSNAAKAAFFAASKSAISYPKHMPHSHKGFDIQREGFACILLCNCVTTKTSNRRIPSQDEDLQRFLEAIRSIQEGNYDFKCVAAGLRGASNARLLEIANVVLERYRFCVSSVGSLMMAPPLSCKGDLICILFGCGMPVVLRKNPENHSVFVRLCYVHGIMGGEAINDFVNRKFIVTKFWIL
jgi:hypothetical protein